MNNVCIFLKKKITVKVFPTFYSIQPKPSPPHANKRKADSIDKKRITNCTGPVTEASEHVA